MTAAEVVELRRLLVLMRIDHARGDRKEVAAGIESAIALLNGEKSNG